MKVFATATLMAAAVSAFPFPWASLNSREQKCDNPGRIVGLVIDASSSNIFTDPKNVRLDGGRDVVDFLTSAAEATASNKADKVAVLSFTTNSAVHYALGDPNAAARDSLSKVKSWGGTDVYRGVEGGLSQIKSAGNLNGRGGLIVFTDGQDGEADVQKLITLLKQAKADGIRVSLGHLATPPNKYYQSPDDYLRADVQAAVMATGGTAATITNAQSQKAFVQQVIKNGITNNDGKCDGNDVGESGGPIENEVITGGLCSNNAKAVYTYSPRNGNEKLEVAIALLSTSNPVTLTAVIENKATGVKSQVVVNRANPKLSLNGVAAKGQQVTVTVTPSGGDDSQTCQYTVGLKTTPDTNPQPQPSSQAPQPSSQAPQPSSQAPQPSSQAPQPSSQAPQPSSQAPQPSSQAPQPSSQAPQPSSQAPQPSSQAPSPSSQAPSPSSQAPSPSSQAPSPSSQAPSPSSQAPSPSSQAPSPSSQAPSPSSQAPSPSSAVPTAEPTTCAPGPAQTVVQTVTGAGATETVVSTVIQTVIQTATATATVTVPAPAETAPATPSVCMCKCDTPGAKPFPKFEL